MPVAVPLFRMFCVPPETVVAEATPPLKTSCFPLLMIVLLAVAPALIFWLAPASLMIVPLATPPLRFWQAPLSPRVVLMTMPP